MVKEKPHLQVLNDIVVSVSPVLKTVTLFPKLLCSQKEHIQLTDTDTDTTDFTILIAFKEAFLSSSQMLISPPTFLYFYSLVILQFLLRFLYINYIYK